MEEQKKLYIGNLSYETTESDLREFIEGKGVKTTIPFHLKRIRDLWYYILSRKRWSHGKIQDRAGCWSMHRLRHLRKRLPGELGNGRWRKSTSQEDRAWRAWQEPGSSRPVPCSVHQDHQAGWIDFCTSVFAELPGFIRVAAQVVIILSANLSFFEFFFYIHHFFGLKRPETFYIISWHYIQ